MDGGARELDRPGAHSMLRGHASVGSANQRALAECWAGVEWLCRGWRWRRGCCMRRRGMQRHAEARWRAARDCCLRKQCRQHGEAGALHQPRTGDPRAILACGARRSLRRGRCARPGDQVMKHATCREEAGRINRRPLAPLGERRERPARRRAGAGRELRRPLRERHGGGRLEG